MNQSISVATYPGDLSRMLNPGTPVSLGYQDVTNQETSTERLFNQNRSTIGFPSLQLGTNSVSFNIPNEHILGNCVANMAFPQLPADVYLPRGWGLRLIEEVYVTIAGSQQIRMTYVQMLNQLLRECDNAEKRLELIKNLAGEEVTDGPNQPAPSCHVPIALPWSSIRFMTHHIGLDTKLMSQPISITFKLASRESLFSGSGAANAPTALTRGNLQFEQDEFIGGSEQNERARMLGDPQNNIYSYRFIYPQPSNVTLFTGSTDANNPVNVNLVAFQAGNLQSIVLNIQNENDVNGGAEGIKNPLFFEQMKKLVVTFNGQIIYQADDTSDGGEWCLGNSLAGICSADSSYCPAGQVTSPFTTIPKKTHWNTVLLVPRDEASWANLLQTGQQMSSQTLVCTFLTDTTDSYKLYATYNYSVDAVIQNGNAQIVYT